MYKIKKILINKGSNKFYIKDLNKDFHTQFGFIRKTDLKKAKNGDKLKTNTNKEFSIFSPSFIDVYRKIKRIAQIITLKDIGIIITETGINKASKVIDAGSGSGALACFLAHLVKEVTTYEIRDDFIEIVKKNKELLNLKNLRIKNKDIYNEIDEKNIDLIVLDLPEPWNALESAKKSLKIGGFLVSYSPSITQTIDFVNKISKDNNFIHIKTIELIQREWEIEDRKVRPKTRSIGHTGFLSFIRRV
jgi:tRNA (adenine57-N1/adenine58-N1)-methyltransferase